MTPAVNVSNVSADTFYHPIDITPANTVWKHIVLRVNVMHLDHLTQRFHFLLGGIEITRKGNSEQREKAEVTYALLFN